MTTREAREAITMTGFDVKAYALGVMLGCWHVDDLDTAMDIVEEIKAKSKIMPYIDVIQVIEFCKGEPYYHEKYGYNVTEVWRDTETHVNRGGRWEEVRADDLLPLLVRGNGLKERPL